MPGHERYVGMLAIPYLVAGDRPVQLRFRCMVEHEHQYHGKYNTVAGDPGRLFNVRAVVEADDELHVCEGEFDAIVLQQIGLPAVAVPGVSMWKPHYARLMADFRRVWVWGDPDQAGGEFTNTLTHKLRNAVGVRLPGLDVNDTYKTYGSEALLSLAGK